MNPAPVEILLNPGPMSTPGFTTRPELAGTFGMVSSTHWLASQAGMAALERGGNAFDGAVAAGFVLQVVEPHMNGLGGDAVLLAHKAGWDAPQVLCGQGTAPFGATLAHFRGLGLDMVPGTGHLSAVVPGAFDAWLVLLRDLGTQSLREVLTPAIGYARDGFPIIPGISATIGNVADLFRAEWPSSAAVWLPDGKPPGAGSLFRNPDLADTFERLLKAGEAAGGSREQQIDAARNAFYRGFVADAVERFMAQPHMDTSGRRHAGVLTAHDMAQWQATWEPAVAVPFAGLQVFKAGPWTQGPMLLQALRLLDTPNLKGIDPFGADFVHVVVEATKLALADREAWYADPLFADVPLDDLLSTDYAAERRALLGSQASAEFTPGHPGGRTPIPAPYLTGALAVAGAGEPTRVERELSERPAKLGPKEGDTCHLDVADRFGNMIACTPSGGWLQSTPTVPGLGLQMPSRGQMFWLHDTHPARLIPGARPRTTLTPSLALRDGAPYLAFGSPGGDNQDQWILQFLLRHAVFGLNLQAAIDAPMFQTDHMPSSFFPRRALPKKVVLEERFGPAVIAELEKRGHVLEVAGPWSLGRNCAVARDGDLLKGAATPRIQQAYAVGR